MTTIFTPNAPKPIGPYSQAVAHNQTLYISGQVGIDPKSGVLKSDSLRIETIQVLENLKAVLQSQELGLSQIIKCSIFILDMNRFKEINDIYAEYFKDHHPARETVEVSKLPAGAQIEISAIAAY